MNNATYDCIVIGGGPAGSTVATLVAQKGHKVLLLERGNFPRFHIGESLMPETYWTFKRLNMLPKMKASRFVKKYSVQFVGVSGRESQPFYFDDMNPHECSQTWQVVRSEFDQMMIENAAEHGVEVWQDANVTDVILEPTPDDHLPRARGVVVSRGGQPAQRIDAKVVVDATGTSALLSRKLNIRHGDPNLKKAAVFAHYKGARRDQGKNEGATLVISLPEQAGWFWYIPLPDDVVSVGVVAEPSYLFNDRGAPEQVLGEEIAKTSAMVPRMQDATRVSPVHVLSDFTYKSQRCAGEGWVLVGDAWAFLDPIYSSGVFIALKSGEMAADAINEAFDRDDFSAIQLSKWGQEMNAGYNAIRKLVFAFYTKGFSFGQFMREHPYFQRNLTELLIGDVFRPEVMKIFETMKQKTPLPEPTPLADPPDAAMALQRV